MNFLSAVYYEKGFPRQIAEKRESSFFLRKYILFLRVYIYVPRVDFI